LFSLVSFVHPVATDNILLSTDSFCSGEGPIARNALMKSSISSTNSGASAEETHLARRRSSLIPLNFNNGLKKRTRFWVE